MSHWQMDDAFLGHHKVVRALRSGAEALQMWCALRTYVAINLSDGFIPDEDINDLPHAPKNPRKWLKVLVECGAPIEGGRGAGLVDAAPGGWTLHDYGTSPSHGESKTTIELRRAQSRERQQRFRDGRQRVSNAVTNAVTNASHTTPLHTSPDPDLTRNVGAKDLTGQSAEKPPEPPPHSGVFSEKPEQKPEPSTPVPLNLVEQMRSLGILEELSQKHGGSEADVAAVVDEFVGYWSVGPGSGKRKVGWLYQARIRVADAAKHQKLIGRATPIGAAEHAARTVHELGLPAGWTRHPALPGLYLDATGATRKSLPGARSGVRRSESPMASGELVSGNVAALLGQVGRALP